MASNYDERKKVFESIKVLVKSEQEELFRIIRKTKVNYTEIIDCITRNIQSN